MNQIIKIKMDTKQVLDTLKIVERESYDGVIKRLILASPESEQFLTSTAKDLLKERIRMKEQGKAISIKGVLEKMKKENKKLDPPNGKV